MRLRLPSSTAASEDRCSPCCTAVAIDVEAEDLVLVDTALGVIDDRIRLHGEPFRIAEGRPATSTSP